MQARREDHQSKGWASPCSSAPDHRHSAYREEDQETPLVPALAGLTELAAVIETDEEAKQLIENVVDLNALISEISDLPKDPVSPDVTARVMKLLSRAEMLASPEALAAVRAEADGLRSVPTWDEDNPSLRVGDRLENVSSERPGFDLSPTVGAAPESCQGTRSVTQGVGSSVADVQRICSTLQVEPRDLWLVDSGAT